MDPTFLEVPVSMALLSGSALALLALGLPLWRGKVPPNRFLGFRTPRTLSDRGLWYRVNAQGGADLCRLGALLLALCLLGAADTLSPSGVLLAYLVLMNLGFVALLLRGLSVIARHAAR
jgi:hypothetical protein